MFTKPRLLHRRGTRAAQPAANGFGVGEGTLYFVTDEGVLERSNGTIWQSFASGSSSSISGTLTAPRVPFASGVNTLTDDAGLTYDVANVSLGINLGNLLFTSPASTPATPAAGLRLYSITSNGHTRPAYVDQDGTVIQMSRDTTLLVRNTSGAPIAKGKAVDINGSTGQVPTIQLADADAFSGSRPRHCEGFTLESIANNAFGLMLLTGVLTGIDTSAFTEGDAVFLSTTAGDITGTAPSAAGSFVQYLGVVTNSHATQGSILVEPETPNAPLAGLTTPRIPYVGSGNVFSDSPSMRWNDTTKTLELPFNGQTLEPPESSFTPNIHLGGDFSGPASGTGVIYIDGYGAQPNITMRRINGTQAAPAALAASDIIFNFRSVGYDGSVSALGGLMRMIANGAWTGANHGEDFVILLTANGSTAAPAERARLTGRSNWLLGTSSEPSTGTMGLFFGDGTVPATLGSNTAGLYANDVSGTVNLFGINEADEVTQLTGGIGYPTGQGGVVTQITSKATGVTLSKYTGEITMNNAALAAATTVSFTLTNTKIAASDVLVLNHSSGGTLGSYLLNAACAAGSAVIYVRNITAGSLSEAIVIRFTVMRGAVA